MIAAGTSDRRSLKVPPRHPHRQRLKPSQPSSQRRATTPKHSPKDPSESSGRTHPKHAKLPYRRHPSGSLRRVQTELPTAQTRQPAPGIVTLLQFVPALIGGSTSPPFRRRPRVGGLVRRAAPCVGESRATDGLSRVAGSGCRSPTAPARTHQVFLSLASIWEPRTSDEQAVAGVITFWAAARLGLLLP